LKKKGNLPADDTIDNTLLECALGDKPNKHSALVLHINYWDNLDPHGKYKGFYEYNESTGKVKGNPAYALLVQTLLKSIKNGLGGDKTT
ncbi:hypothetical protein Moror_15163, partial [Moniliophthora roreri MCA 2997]